MPYIDNNEMKRVTDRLLVGEHCYKCGSYQISLTDDWWVSCRNCGDEESAAPLLAYELARILKEMAAAPTK